MVKIISDSTCDLSQELLRKYDIDILPLHILLGDKEYEDGKNTSITSNVYSNLQTQLEKIKSILGPEIN